jgi:hypothetical protein
MVREIVSRDPDPPRLRISLLAELLTDELSDDQVLSAEVSNALQD